MAEATREDPMTLQERHEQFQALVEGHKGILYKVCHSYGADTDDREDLAQEILIQLWRSFPSFDARSRFSTWMYRVALNVAISHYRRERVHGHAVRVGDQRLLEVADEAQAVSEEVRWARQYIAELDPLNRALVLLYLDGYTHREIADTLGLTETNVGTKISRLKKEMREKFDAAEAA